MNKIILKKSTHRNFMSYGDTPNEFTFPNGVMLMTAANGSGKSTIVEVINFALFGTSYRGGTKSELRNTNNGTATLEVSLEFDVDHGNAEIDSYRLYRTISPKGTMKFDLEKMVDGKWVPQNKRAGFTQKDFEDKILGFNEVLFKNVIAMNTQESTPFIDMPAAKRRELLESIIDMSTEFWKKESGRMLSAASTACDIAASDINRINGEIANLERICESLRNEKKANLEQMEADFEANKSRELSLSAEANALAETMQGKYAEINGYAAEIAQEQTIDAAMERIHVASASVDQLSDAEKNLADCRAALELVAPKYSKVAYDELVGAASSLAEEINAVKTAISSNERDVTRLETEVSLCTREMDKIALQGKQLKAGVPCPTCGKLSTEEDVEPQRQELRNQWTTKKEYRGTLNDKIVQLNAIIGESRGKLDDLVQQHAQKTAAATEMNDYYYSTVYPATVNVNNAEAAVVSIRGKIADAGIDISLFADEMQRLQAEKAKFPEIRAKWQAAYNEYNDMQTKNGQLGGEIVSLRNELARLQGEIDRARSVNNADTLSITEGRLAETRADLEAATNRLHEQSDLKAGYTYISKNLCSDDGMKKMLFGLFVPAFNKSVQKNLIHAGLPFSIEFNDSMSYEFITAPGLSPSYVMLSQGQRRKLGFAISMAFRDFVAMVGNFSINLLSLDEVIDQSTDDNAMRDMMDLVRSMIDDIGCALVITHRSAAVMDKFDYWTNIEYDGLYSSVGELKKL